MGKRKKKVIVEETPVVEDVPESIPEEAPVVPMVVAGDSPTLPVTGTPREPLIIDGLLINIIAELPEPKTKPTTRWYGEQFLPAYTEARNKLRQLAGL